LSSVAVAAFVVVVAGCGGSGGDSAQPAAVPANAGAHAEHDQGGQPGQEGADQQAGGDQHAPPSELAKYADVLAELPMEERMAVYKQKVCPVSGEPLGAMGKPYKVTVKDRDVFLCCPGCEAKITADPDTYLAKLAK
jgi:hypothetical protein